MSMTGYSQNNNKTNIYVDEKDDTEEPKQWKVIFIDDDYTPKDFVVLVLMKLFNKPNIEATRLMEEVHNTGSSIVGIYSKEIAETKIAKTDQMSELNGFPFQIRMEM